MAFEGRWTMMALLVAGLLLQGGIKQANAAEWFEVGDDNGWTFPPNGIASFFDDWAKENTFHVNDTLFFRYQFHSVLEVSKADAASCTTTAPINSYLDKENATVTLDREGYYAFICGFASHCVANMKMELTVLAPGELAAPAGAPDAGSPLASEAPGFTGGPAGATSPLAGENGKSGASGVRSFPALILGALVACCAVLFL